jgi:hypothetical protein
MAAWQAYSYISSYREQICSSIFYPSEGCSGTKHVSSLLTQCVIFFCFLVEEISTYKNHLFNIRASFIRTNKSINSLDM